MEVGEAGSKRIEEEEEEEAARRRREEEADDAELEILLAELELQKEEMAAAFKREMEKKVELLKNTPVRQRWGLINLLDGFIKKENNKGKLLRREINLSEECELITNSNNKYEDWIQTQSSTTMDELWWPDKVDKYLKVKPDKFQWRDIKALDCPARDSFSWDFPMDYDYKSSLDSDVATGTTHCLQIYSLKLTTTTTNSLQVYGLLHVYSDGGKQYQVSFDRDRDHCQTLTENDPYLLMTGPTLPPLAFSTVRIQGTLKLKSTTQSEEEDTFLTVYICNRKRKLEEADPDFESEDQSYTSPMPRVQGELCEFPPRKHYLLEMTSAVVVFSVLATISVQVKQGVLPGCCIAASTTSFPDMKVVLLDYRDTEVGLDCKDGMVQLSRRTICVEFGGKLKVCIEHGGGEIEEMEFSTGKNVIEDAPTVRTHSVHIDSCTIEVKVTWVNYWRWFSDKVGRLVL